MSGRTRPYIDENYTEMMQRLRESLPPEESRKQQIQRWRQSSDPSLRLLNFFGENINIGDSVDFLRFTTAKGLELSGELTVLAGGNINIKGGGNINIKGGGNINIKGGGGISVEAGGDIILVGRDSDPAKLIFDGSTVNLEIYVNSTGTTSYIVPTTDADQPTLIIGNNIFYDIDITAKHDVQVLAKFDANDFARMLVDADGGGQPYAEFFVFDGIYFTAVRLSISGSTPWFGPIADGFLDLGQASFKFRDGYFAGEVSTTKIKMTSIGGLAIKLTNKTGDPTVAGELVEVYSVLPQDDAFRTCDANSDACIGIVYEAGVADGSEAWIVTGGIADVLIDAGGCARHDRIISSGTAGSADVWNTGGAVATHFQEIGHALETRVGAGLARVAIHFL